MRISQGERQAILNAILCIDPDAQLWLFGSRVDDTKRGGDIDLAIHSTRIDMKSRIRIRRAIVDSIGEQKIDIVVSADENEPFFKLATERGVRLNG